MIKIIENPDTNHLIESFQVNDIKFAFASENKDGHFQLIHTWVKCREYFNELLMKNMHPDTFEFKVTYGFNYKYDQYPMDLTRTMFAVKFPSDETRDNFLANLEFLHKIEEFNSGVDKTIVETTEDPRILFIIGSKFWQQKALLLNVYTMLVKLMTLNFPKKSYRELLNSCREYTPSELSYITTVGPDKFEALLHNLTSVVEIPSTYVDGSDTHRGADIVHGNSGICAVLTYDLGDHTRKFVSAVRALCAKKVTPVFMKELA